MSNKVTWTVRTPKDLTDPVGEPEQNLRLCDLKWLVSEAERMGVGDYGPVQYEAPINSGDPQGWGLTITREFD
jgi:hypothetical protein